MLVFVLMFVFVLLERCSVSEVSKLFRCDMKVACCIVLLKFTSLAVSSNACKHSKRQRRAIKTVQWCIELVLLLVYSKTLI